jgi:tetratricopeptide (TPR) repeat protein
MHLREPTNVAEVAEGLCTLANEQQLPRYGALGSGHRGWAMAEQGRTDEGILLIRAGLALPPHHPEMLRELSEALARAGQFEEALAAIEQAFSAVGELHIYLPDELWWRGELHLRCGDETKAAGDFQEAIAVARRIGSKAYELRAATSLARMIAKQGKRDEARTMLGEIYNWFTEGFNTADLKDARALLDELRN